MTQIAVVTATGLHLRRDPSTARPPIATLPRGTRMEILSTVGAWYGVRTDAGRGFVHGDFVALLDQDPAAGFLHEKPEFTSLPLAAPEAERLAVPSSAPWAERHVARTWNRLGGLLGPLSEHTGLDPGIALAVFLVESAGSGFDASGRLVVRFENHVFRERLGEPRREEFDRHFTFDPSRRWQQHRFREQPGNPWTDVHGHGQDGEWRVLTFARELDDTAALYSISMGAPQIMGFNHHLIGHSTVQRMFEHFSVGERFQVLGFFDFVKGPGSTSTMLSALERRRFSEFASLYNGPGQAARYAGRIEDMVGVWRQVRGT